MRDELLDVEEFSCLAEARVVIEDWREDYNRQPAAQLARDARPRRVRRALEPRQRGARRCCLTAVATERRRWPALRHTAAVLAELPRDAGEDLLARLDRVVPGRIAGFYVVGSASMGAFRPGRSDVDFVAIVDGDFRPAELRKLRALHVGGWVSALIHDTAWWRRWPLVCNGVYLKAGDLSRSPLEVTPLAGHVTGRFRAAPRSGFDVNPVTWYVLAHHGVALRGPAIVTACRYGPTKPSCGRGRWPTSTATGAAGRGTYVPLA